MGENLKARCGVFFDAVGNEVAVNNYDLTEDEGVISYYVVRAYKRLGSERYIAGELHTFIKPQDDVVKFTMNLFNAQYAEVVEVYESY